MKSVLVKGSKIQNNTDLLDTDSCLSCQNLELVPHGIVEQPLCLVASVCSTPTAKVIHAQDGC